jgi:hypothetical protein
MYSVSNALPSRDLLSTAFMPMALNTPKRHDPPGSHGDRCYGANSMAALHLALRSVGYQLDNLSKWRAFQGSLVDNLREQFGLIGCLCH